MPYSDFLLALPPLQILPLKNAAGGPIIFSLRTEIKGSAVINI